ncbi:TPA: winged helix-turn-helix domain-containing protein, partial [Acinetobacter baumannii]|nr:winged helix-turn-helix domain-containing protein [Acinetobacter baumannii]
QRLLFILEGYGNYILIQDHHIQISQEQLANMLTTSRQTINHELSLLEKQNIIKIAFRKIEILDIEKLKVIAQVHS